MLLPLILLFQAVEPDPSVNTTTVTASKSAKPKRICRSVEHSGSMFRDRICKTADEWRSASESTGGSEDLQRLQHGAGMPKPE